MDAILLQLDEYQKQKKNLDGRSSCLPVIVYQLETNSECLLQSLTYADGKRKSHRDSNLVFKAVSNISGFQLEVVERKFQKIMETEDGKKILARLHELCQTVMSDSRQKHQSTTNAESIVVDTAEDNCRGMDITGVGSMRSYSDSDSVTSDEDTRDGDTRDEDTSDDDISVDSISILRKARNLPFFRNLFGIFS